MEAEYIDRLRREMRLDSFLWKKTLPELESKEKSLNRVLEWARHPDFNEPRLRILATQITEGCRYAFSAGSSANRRTYDELQSTGRFAILSNVQLRNRLSLYYMMIDRNTLRLSGRETDYFKKAYELVPRNSEYAAREGLSHDELNHMAEELLVMNLEGPITAELNRSLLIRDHMSKHIPAAEELIELLANEQNK